MRPLSTTRTHRAHQVSVWDRQGIMAEQAVFMSAFADNVNSTRHLAASAPQSDDWQHALPLSTCGLRLDNEVVAVICGSSPASHTRALVANRSTQEVRTASCASGRGRSKRHREFNDIICLVLSRTNTPSVLELSRLAHQRKMTGWPDPHSMAMRKEFHTGCHRHRHYRRLVRPSNINDGWWRCRER